MVYFLIALSVLFIVKALIHEGGANYSKSTELKQIEQNRHNRWLSLGYMTVAVAIWLAIYLKP